MLVTLSNKRNLTEYYKIQNLYRMTKTPCFYHIFSLQSVKAKIEPNPMTEQYCDLLFLPLIFESVMFLLLPLIQKATNFIITEIKL